MFKKKPIIKALAPLRSSDRRKLGDEVISRFELTSPDSAIQVASLDVSGTEADDATKQRSILRNALCPENLQSARFMTTQGPDLRPVSGTVYVGSHTKSDAPRVLWFWVDDQLCPTVYTLWRFPRLIPDMLTADMVIDKLQGGADLMTPGLGNGPPFDRRATKGAVVAVSGVSKPDQPMAVGTCLVDISALGSVQGVKGAAVRTLHVEGDELWSFSMTGKAGIPYEEYVAKMPEDMKVVTDKAAGLNLAQGDEHDGGVALGESAQDDLDRTSDLARDTSAPADDTKLSIKDIDAAFKNAFLYAIYTQRTEHDPPTHGLSFPLTQSATMTLIQPYLPIHNPSDASQLQIKNTSYKNIKKFIKSLDKEALVKSKERDKHETVILDIDFEDPQVVSFQPYPLASREPQSTTGPASTELADDDTSVGQKLDIVQLYKPPTAFTTLIGADTFPVTLPQLRAKLNSYLDSHALFSTPDKRTVKFTPDLIASLGPAGPHDAELRTKGTLPLSTILTRLTNSSTPYWTISRTPTSTSTSTSTPTPKPTSGTVPKITIKLDSRGSNKSVTKIHGLEEYLIAPQGLADELRRTCACATSVEKLEGSSPRKPVMCVRVQGKQRKAVLDALARRGVGEKWVNDLTAKK